MKRINTVRILSYSSLFLCTQIALAQSPLPPLPKTDATVQGYKNNSVAPPSNIKAPPMAPPMFATSTAGSVVPPGYDKTISAPPVVMPSNVKGSPMSTTSAVVPMSTTSAVVPMPAPMERPANLPVQTTTAPPLEPEISPVVETPQQTDKGFFARIVSFIKGLFSSN